MSNSDKDRKQRQQSLNAYRGSLNRIDDNSHLLCIMRRSFSVQSAELEKLNVKQKEE